MEPTIGVLVVKQVWINIAGIKIHPTPSVVVNIILTVSNIGHPFFLQVHGLDLPVWINKLSPLTTNLLSLH